MKQGSTSLQCIRQIVGLSEQIAESTNLFTPPLEERDLLSDSFFTDSLEADATHTIVSANALKITTANPVRTGYLYIDETNFAPTPKQKYLLECWVYVVDTGANIAPFYTESDLFPRYAPKLGIGVPPIAYEPTNEPVVFEVLNEWVGSEATTGQWTKLQTVFWAIDNVLQTGIYLHWENPTHPYSFEIWVDGFTLREYEVKSVMDSEITSEFELDTDAKQDIALTYSITDFSVSDSAKNNFTKSITAISTENNHKNFDFFNSVSDNYNSETIRAILKIEGVPIFEGELRLIEATTARRHVKYNDSYSVYLKETSRDWANGLQDKQLTDLNYLDYQLFRVEEVVQTFTNDYNSPNTPNADYLNSDHAVFPYFIYGDDSHDFYNATTPSINLNNLRPAFFVKNLIEAIFRENGYVATFEGFTTLPEFESLILPYSKEQFLHDIGFLRTYLNRECYHFTYFRFEDDTFVPFYLPYTTPDLQIPIFLFSQNTTLLDTAFEIAHSRFQNPAKIYGLTAGRYKITLYFQAEADFELLPEVYPEDYTIFSHTANIGETYSYIPTANQRGFIASFEVDMEQCEFGTIYFGFQSESFTYGVIFRKNTDTNFKVFVPVDFSDYAIEVGPSSFFMSDGVCAYIEATGDHEVREGNNVFLNLNKQLPDLTQLELLQGVASLYNLQFVSERGSNEIKVIAETDFTLPTDSSKVWTNKLDETIITKKPVLDKPTNFLSSYTEDSSDEALPENYGNDTYKNPYKVTNDNTEITTTIFASTYFESPQVWLTLPKASKFGLVQRILLYEGNTSTLGNSIFIQHSCPLQNFEVENFYPKATFTGLSFKTENGITGLRERFWQNAIDLQLNGILFEAYFALNLLDILELDFGKHVQIKNEFYKLQSVNDFRATLDKITKCVLVKIGAGRYTEPTPDSMLWEDGEEAIFEGGEDILF